MRDEIWDEVSGYVQKMRRKRVEGIRQLDMFKG
jgi:hypothetical protein